MSVDTETERPEPALADDGPDIVHVVCCVEPLEVGGPTFCGSSATNPDPPVDGLDQDCVVCADLADGSDCCPRFGVCTEIETPS